MKNSLIIILPCLIICLCKDVQPAIDDRITDFQRSCSAKCSEHAQEARTCSVQMPRHYVAHHLNGKVITVDGHLDEDAWKEVPWTENFVDIRGVPFPVPPVETKVKVRWDDKYVYVGAYLEEPHVWATYTKKDSRIYQENAFEIFFDVDNSMSMYKEFEINALGTTWDLLMTKPYIDGGDYHDWEGVYQKGVYTDGQVNNASVSATFWSVEVSFPFSSLSENTTRSDRAAVGGEMWFMEFARPRYTLDVLPDFTYEKKAGTGTSWYAWNPTGAVNLHLPSKWGLLYFSTEKPQSNTLPDINTSRWISYQALFDVFNAVKTFQVQTGTLMDQLGQLDLPPYISDSCFLSVDVTHHGGNFTVVVESRKEPGMKGYITQDRHVHFSSS